MTANKWSSDPANHITQAKSFLSHLSLIVRSEQMSLMQSFFSVMRRTKVLDVGISPREDLIDTNFFEKFYVYPKNLTAASVEDCRNLTDRYPGIKIVKINQGSRLPFRAKQFDLAVSWATLEHVGDYAEQEKFINELLRVGKKVFITTPYRGCIYEPHTGKLFLHWLPLGWFRKLLKDSFWAKVENLNPLYVKDINKMKLSRKVEVKIYKMLGILPSHIVLTSR